MAYVKKISPKLVLSRSRNVQTLKTGLSSTPYVSKRFQKRS
ncbi:hypothetical protein TNIN_439771, partial [Trichonephila inaurata madagascariensis]